MKYGTATAIFCDIRNPEITIAEKIEAIEKIANLETHNGYKKDLFIEALRWLFDTYDFETGEKEIIRRSIRVLKGGGGDA